RLMGNDVTDAQAKWRDDAIMRSQSTSLIERRVRMALGMGDRRADISGSWQFKDGKVVQRVYSPEELRKKAEAEKVRRLAEAE
ncbi:tail fiber assembly protein, partial [Salmonella enterica subsp. enterica serovar Montevideo]|nr:tail fiber assembly protein [Salmonella enterica subsp. enterica serovar Montevideo]